jgi:hypothetical protein
MEAAQKVEAILVTFLSFIKQINGILIEGYFIGFNKLINYAFVFLQKFFLRSSIKVQRYFFILLVSMS